VGCVLHNCACSLRTILSDTRGPPGAPWHATQYLVDQRAQISGVRRVSVHLPRTVGPAVDPRRGKPLDGRRNVPRMARVGRIALLTSGFLVIGVGCERSKAVVDSRDPSVSVDAQLAHQSWEDPARLSIGLDCPPGSPRPDEVLPWVLKGTGLADDDFEVQGPPVFGAQDVMLKANSEAIGKFLGVRHVLKRSCIHLRREGWIRGWMQHGPCEDVGTDVQRDSKSGHGSRRMILKSRNVSDDVLRGLHLVL